jgi:hypothetical protein
MEFIQWHTQGLDEITHEPIGEVTNCALFKFNTPDLEILSEDVLQEIDKQMKEHEGEYVSSMGFKYLWVAEDDKYQYQLECIKIFTKVLGLDLYDLLD